MKIYNKRTTVIAALVINSIMYGAALDTGDTGELKALLARIASTKILASPLAMVGMDLVSVKKSLDCLSGKERETCIRETIAARDFLGRSFLHISVTEKQDPNFILFYAQIGVDPCILDSGNGTALHRICQSDPATIW